MPATSAETIKMSVADVVALMKKADKAAAEELFHAITEVAQAALEIAEKKATEEGFEEPGESGRGTGKLLRSLSYSIRKSDRYGPGALLRETAVSDAGFRYPAVFEFGHREDWMRRPFMFPAIDEIEPEAWVKVQEAIDKAIATTGMSSE